LENTEEYPDMYAELYSYDADYSRMFLITESDDSKCLGTPDWKTDNPDDGAYGIYFTDYFD
jgi:hypothetical protein